MPNTKIARNNLYMSLTEANGQEKDQDSVGSSKRRFFGNILIPFHLIMQKDLQQNCFT